MSLRPVTKARHRAGRRVRLNGQKKWSSNWSWNDVKRFDPSKHKRALLGLFIMAIILFVGVWSGDSGNVLFHGTKPSCGPDYAKPGAPCQDPSQVIWQATAPKANLGEFNTFGTVAYSAGCQGGGTSCFTELAGASSTAIALSNVTIGDLSIASKSLLAFHMTLGTAQVLTQGVDFGWYLTTNATVPQHAIGSTSAYNPASDPSVVLQTLYECTANCGGATPTYLDEARMLRTVGKGDTLLGEDKGSSPSSSVYLTNSQTFTPSVLDSALYLNYTGVVNGGSCTVSGSPGVIGPAPGCSWLLNQQVGGSALSASWVSTQTLPWFQLQVSQYYIGFYTLPSAAGPTIFFTFNNGGSNGNMDIFQFVPSTAGPPIDTGGFFGPVIKALINLGVFILNALLSFVSFIAPAIQAALNFLETQIINLLNVIGNALGFGNIGSDLATFLNSMITFFTNNSYGLPAFFGFFGTYFTNFLRWMQIDFQFIGPIFSIANAILIFGVNGILEGITIITIGLQMLLFGYGTFIVFAYFIYVGDDGIGGLFTFLGTLEAISFKILNSIVIFTNLGLDFIITIISLIPKPFIQMTATRIPRLPTIESNSTMSFPTLDFGEARNGNLIVYWLWCMGLWFVAWFESQNPSLPGSIGMLDPAIAVNVRQLSTYIPLLQAATLISGGLVLAWFAMLPMRLAGIDVTQAPLGASLGRRAGPGPSSVHISGGKKHLLGPAKKAEQLRQAQKGFKGKKEEQAKQAIEKRKKELEEKKRSEELRQKELARKPTGKDLRGPNL